MVIAVLSVGTAIALLGGGWIGVSYLLNPQTVRPVPVIPQERFTPALPSLPLSSDSIDKECRDFFDQDDAQKYYEAQGGPTSDPDGLDLDNDGQACENYPYSSSSTTSTRTLGPNLNDK